MKALHLLPDDKFTDHVVDVFETCRPGENVFLVGLASDKPRYSFKSSKVVSAPYNSDGYHAAIPQDADIVFIHFLDRPKAHVLKRLPKTIKKVWLMWGGDFYESGFFRRDIYQSHTKKTLIKLLSRRKPWKYRIPFFLYYKCFKPGNGLVKTEVDPVLLEAARQIDFAATVIPSEFAMLSEIQDFKAKQVYFSYGTTKSLISDPSAIVNNQRTGVLIGNSINPSANHIDVFYVLHKLKGIDKVIVPLNYGGAEDYRDEVIRQGRRLFSNRFMPIVDFMPLDAYNKLVQECRIAIFAHERQQALGNIISALYMGAKVFLSEKSEIYRHFKSKKMILFSVQKDLVQSNLVPLTPAEIANNRDILDVEYGPKQVLSRISQTIATLTEA